MNREGKRLIVRRQKSIFGLKCAISGNNHFFAFFDCSWYVDKILPGWELNCDEVFRKNHRVPSTTTD